MKICVATETQNIKLIVSILIKQTKLIVYHIRNATSFTSYKCLLPTTVVAAPLLNAVHFILSAAVCHYSSVQSWQH